MPEVELFLLFVRPLQRAGIRYIVTGSVAAIFYGEPRLTIAERMDGLRIGEHTRPRVSWLAPPPATSLNPLHF
jgi:hypothetical protein